MSQQEIHSNTSSALLMLSSASSKHQQQPQIHPHNHYLNYIHQIQKLYHKIEKTFHQQPILTATHVISEIKSKNQLLKNVLISSHSELQPLQSKHIQTIQRNTICVQYINNIKHQLEIIKQQLKYMENNQNKLEQYARLSTHQQSSQNIQNQIINQYKQQHITNIKSNQQQFHKYHQNDNYTRCQNKEQIKLLIQQNKKLRDNISHLQQKIFPDSQNISNYTKLQKKSRQKHICLNSYNSSILRQQNIQILESKQQLNPTPKLYHNIYPTVQPIKVHHLTNSYNHQCNYHFNYSSNSNSFVVNPSHKYQKKLQVLQYPLQQRTPIVFRKQQIQKENRSKSKKGIYVSLSPKNY